MLQLIYATSKIDKVNWNNERNRHAGNNVMSNDIIRQDVKYYFKQVRQLMTKHMI